MIAEPHVVLKSRIEDRVYFSAIEDPVERDYNPPISFPETSARDPPVGSDVEAKDCLLLIEHTCKQSSRHIACGGFSFSEIY
jgi:hypothetical protein